LLPLLVSRISFLLRKLPRTNFEYPCQTSIGSVSDLSATLGKCEHSRHFLVKIIAESDEVASEPFTRRFGSLLQVEKGFLDPVLESGGMMKAIEISALD